MMARSTVFLVSHRGPMRRLLELLLRREGYPVESRASGAAVLKALRRSGSGHRSVVLYEATTRWALVV
jgi:phosphohistidine phosphatase SixA